METNNISLKNLNPEMKSQLVKQPYAKRRQMCNLIEKNIGKEATITVRPHNPIKQLTKLHPNHKIMVNSGWIKAISLGYDEKLLLNQKSNENGNSSNIEN